MNPAVEHVRPKVHHPHLEHEWDNFLLACTYCNSNKRDQDVDRARLALPDQDNTFRAFIYGPGARVRINPRLPPTRRRLAQRLDAFVGIARYPGGPRRPTIADRRWQKRQEAWLTADHARTLIEQCNEPATRALTLTLARATGYFSVWMEVFRQDAAFRRELIAAFPGTHRGSFDARTRPRPRRGVGL